MPTRQLTRSKTNKIVAGVAGGIAAYTGFDLSLTRLITFLVVLLTGIGPILYIAAWIILPEEGSATTGLDKIISSIKSHTSNDNPHPGDLR